MNLLELNFQFPFEKPRVNSFDHPEIKLMAVLVAAAKMCYPLKAKSAHSLPEAGSNALPRLDWEHWSNAVANHRMAPSTFGKKTYDDITPSKLAGLGGQELEDYLAHVAGVPDHRST